ncbi:MAG: nucleoside hydrolase [Bacteroidales bacterium]
MNLITGKFIQVIILLALIACTNTSNTSDQSGSDPVMIILDTDMESDVDDVGALAMLHALADFGETEILGVIVCAKNPWSLLCADRINTYFNRPDIPLGQLKGPGVDRESLYARQIAEEFPGTLQSSEDAPDAVSQYRGILASQPDNSVIILSIGYLTNLRDLVLSGPDRISDLSGRDLVEQKVRFWVCMGGQFPDGREANIRWDTPASIEALDSWPTEIIFSGWEIGLMDTGDQITDLPESNPVRKSYELFGRIPHKNWDQVAGLYAVRGLDNGPASEYWQLSEPGKILIESAEGRNEWEESPEGSHRYLIQVGSDKDIAREIDALMMHLPDN